MKINPKVIAQYIRQILSTTAFLKFDKRRVRGQEGF